VYLDKSHFGLKGQEGSRIMKTQTALDTHNAGTAAATQTQHGSIFEHMNNAYDAIARRAFELFEHRGHEHGHDLEDWLSAEEELFLPVPIEITHDENQSTIKAEVPGFDKNDIKVSVEGNRLLISGIKTKTEKNEADGSSFRSESHEEFLRTVDLASDIDPARVEAKLERGTLTITVPNTAASLSQGANITVK
jgi:HSP20 family protein